MPRKKAVKKAVKRAPRVFNEPQDELLKEFKQYHTVKITQAFTEITGVVVGFTKDGVIIRENGQQEHKEFKAGEINFVSDLNFQ